MKVAVVGSGVSGLGAAWALSQNHDVHLFEADARLGGHAHTVDVEIDGTHTAVDTGFIVYNERNYPALTHLFNALEVETEASCMSFAVSLGNGEREYAGTLRGLFGHWPNLFSVQHYKMVAEIIRFYRTAERLLEFPGYRDLSLGDFLRHAGFADCLMTDHLMPMASAIWSSTRAQTLDFPAETFVKFFANHGLLNFKERPKWRTVSGGSRNYVEKIAEQVSGQVHVSTPIVNVARRGAHVILTDASNCAHIFDAVVLAGHADQNLSMLGAGATDMERNILGAITCQDNTAYLHTDERLMPKRKAIWASWNYLAEQGTAADRPVSVTYWMNKLQNLKTPRPVFVSLNPISEPDPEQTHMKYLCRHPQFDAKALSAQKSIGDIQGAGGVYHCGAWMGYGFHEDGLEAGLAVADALGSPAPWQHNIAHKSPSALNACPITYAQAAE